MSQTVQAQSFRTPDSEFQSFDYKPVHVLAPISLIAGILAASSLLSVAGLAVALFGLLSGAIALRKIRKAEGEYKGDKVAWAGIVFSVIFLLGGSSLHSYVYATEVPDGYQRVDFYRDISQKGYQVVGGAIQPHKDVQALDGKKIFLKGYIYPTQQLTGIRNFVLVKDNRQCCFGGQPALTDMIEVFMQGQKTIDDFRGLTAVAGTFHLANANSQSELSPVYRLDAIEAGPAKTAF